MNVTKSWDNEAQSVLRYTLAGAWDWVDFYATFEPQSEICALKNLCLVIDLRQATHIPTDAVLHLQRAASMAKGIDGRIVVIATSTAAVTMYRLFVTVYRLVKDKFQLAASDEEAAKILGMS